MRKQSSPYEAAMGAGGGTVLGGLGGAAGGGSVGSLIGGLGGAGLGLLTGHGLSYAVPGFLGGMGLGAAAGAIPGAVAGGISGGVQGHNLPGNSGLLPDMPPELEQQGGQPLPAVMGDPQGQPTKQANLLFNLALAETLLSKLATGDLPSNPMGANLMPMAGRMPQHQGLADPTGGINQRTGASAPVPQMAPARPPAVQTNTPAMNPVTRPQLRPIG